MTELNLLLELMDIAKDLLADGITGNNVYFARVQMDIIFSRFEEDSDMNVLASPMETILTNIAKKIAQMPEELKQYFDMIKVFQSENEIILQELPPLYATHTIEQVQLMATFFDTLNNLLQTGITPCTAHEAHIKIDDLFKAFEEQAEENEEMAGVDYDDTPNDLNHFFHNIQENLDRITLFPA